MSDRTEIRRSSGDTVQCESPYCEEHVPESATVDVAVGATVGEWTDPVAHIGVTGVDGPTPTVERWCQTCANHQFGVETGAGQHRLERTKQYLTAATAGAFSLGVVLTAIAFLLFG
ncbi:hypothetical protein [Halococcoides cellulosivorans]|uniref:Uncharacterized protein n=1 Tax=Halococcoides cellulosivorans TaxID=1679096 RepID=A0A2R4WY83_9EURY|nr:hypothetical protein [Halococcoides cellulosivorans]AWB26504.1 hypothetical protein HARCEL1_01620 [Halococcoides cellulosivorans]